MYSISNQNPICLFLLLSTTLFPLLTNGLYIRQLPSAPNTKSPRAALIDWDDAPKLRRKAQTTQVATPAYQDPTDLTKRMPVAQRVADLKNSPSGDAMTLSKRDDNDPNSKSPPNLLTALIDNSASTSNTDGPVGSDGGTSSLPKRDKSDGTQSDYDTGSPGGSDSLVGTQSSGSAGSGGSQTGPVNLGDRSIKSPESVIQERDDNNNNDNTQAEVKAQLLNMMFGSSGSDGSGSGGSGSGGSGSGYTGDDGPGMGGTTTSPKVKERSSNTDDVSSFVTSILTTPTNEDWRAERVRREEARQDTPAAIYERQLAARAEWERVENAIARISARGETENDAEWERNDGASEGGARGGKEGDKQKEKEGEDALMGGEEVWRKDLLKRLAILDGKREVQQ